MSSSPRNGCPVAPLPLILLMLLLLLSTSSASAELGDASVIRPRGARRMLVSPPATYASSRLRAERQQMRVGGEKKHFDNVAASFGRRRIPHSGFNPVHNR
ncbi:hypothetical protein BRADI_1g33485v3 [Brachypodium distachyon]|uniref:Uncharacterized protein n=1 Tax=Brachypodium distachyon TaxID=15368 RepID=A0A0Q3H340_BRADI|nr:hypothetical protein BRADI_1g33485v3 [Brachypodium distachyon]